MELSFSPEELQEVERIIKLYPHSKSAVMPVLWMAQKKWGWLSADVQKYVASLLNLPYAHVMGVASFYTMYFKKPMGTYHVQICTNISCMLRGGDDIYKYVCSSLGISHNQTTPDGKISIEEVECMGACGGAPMIAINETFYENVNQDKVNQLIAGLA